MNSENSCPKPVSQSWPESSPFPEPEQIQWAHLLRSESPVYEDEDVSGVVFSSQNSPFRVPTPPWLEAPLQNRDDEDIQDDDDDGARCDCDVSCDEDCGDQDEEKNEEDEDEETGEDEDDQMVPDTNTALEVYFGDQTWILITPESFRDSLH